MQNFTTQEHPRNQSAVVENPGKTIAHLREKQRNRNLINGVIISAMAMAVVVTGSILGSTAAHNEQLKNQVGDLTSQNQALNQQLSELSTHNETPTIDTIDPATYYQQPVKSRILDGTDIAPNFSTEDIRNRKQNNNELTDTKTEQGNDTTTVNPAVMAEPTSANVVTYDEPEHRPALYSNRYRTMVPDSEQPTPMPRVPSGRHVRIW